MNRKEAMHTLKDIFDYFWIEIEDRGIDGELTEIMEVLEKPLTLADLLGWEEDVEYEAMGSKFMISDDNNLYELCNGEWDRCYTCSFSINTHKELQQSKRVEE